MGLGGVPMMTNPRKEWMTLDRTYDVVPKMKNKGRKNKLDGVQTMRNQRNVPMMKNEWNNQMKLDKT